MVIRGTTTARCPACGTEQTCALVQSINTRENPEDKQRLVAGELNVLACACGKRTPLAASVLFHDPDRGYVCQVCPGGEQAMAEGAAAFAASGIAGVRRIVPSQNALVEKVKLLDAGLDDWAIEMTKVLLLASIGELERVLLFESIDRDAGVLRWVIFDDDGRVADRVSSPLGGYDRLATHEASRPRDGEYRVDRAWALDAVKAMMGNSN